MELAEFDESWSGWILRGCELFSPEQWRFTPAKILAGCLREAEIHALRLELKRAHKVQPAYSARLTQWHTLQAAVQALETEIRQRGTDDELDELRQLTNPPRRFSEGV